MRGEFWSGNGAHGESVELSVDGRYGIGCYASTAWKASLLISQGRLLRICGRQPSNGQTKTTRQTATMLSHHLGSPTSPPSSLPAHRDNRPDPEIAGACSAIFDVLSATQAVSNAREHWKPNRRTRPITSKLVQSATELRDALSLRPLGDR